MSPIIESTSEPAKTRPPATDIEQLASQRKIRLEPQQAQLLSLAAGESIDFVATDACQGLELVVLEAEAADAQGQASVTAQPNFSLVDAQLDCQAANAALAQLAQDSPSAKALQAQLSGWGLSKETLKQAYVFDAQQLASQTPLKALQDCWLLCLACGADMGVEGGPVPGELELSIYSPYREQANDKAPYLPPPLASVSREFRIDPATAQAYEVKAGEWIQIIDVQGKQCSDFLAFDAKALELQQELGLDAAATRSYNGHNMPTPGLHSRVFDSNMLPMLELVQDTVGRHDSFLFACTPKYYDDAGYPGHISCTENFNKVLADYGIASRAGWPALNFFFNTQVEQCGTFVIDEPWSRPGDYVLLRAQRDLICASSACPDDIDPANGWQPTDIHVRIYSADQHFDRSMAYRRSPQELPRMTKTTGFDSCIRALTPRLSEYRGYWVADEYPAWGAKAEYSACRERVAMIDLSPLRKFEVVGPDAETLLDYCLTRNVRKLAVGAIVYSAMCHHTGGMIDDGTLFRLCEQTFRWVCGDPSSGQWLRQVAQQQGWQVQVRESTEQLHNIAVQGPLSRALLSELLFTPEHQPSAQDLAWFHFTIGRLGSAEGLPLMVSRTGYTGELGFELWCHPKHAEQLWQAVWQAGQKYDIAPMGFLALDLLRIEAGLIFAEHEFCDRTNPFEAGIGFTVPLKSKQGDFIGREAIAKQNPDSRQQSRGLRIASNVAVYSGDEIYQGRYRVGEITSACFSPLLGQQIALARLSPEFSASDTELEIGKLDGQQKRLSARVCDLPFYDPERSRVRS